MKSGRCHAAAFAPLVVLGLAAACGGDRRESPPAPLTAESPVVLNEKWRAKHETDYRRDWVTIAGLHPLKPGANTAGSAASNDIVLPASVPARARPLRPQRSRPSGSSRRQTPRFVLNGQPVTAASRPAR